MKKTWIVAATLMSFGVLGELGQTQTASAATKLGTSVPQSLRGTWYDLNSQMGIMRVKMTAKTYSISTGFFIKGKWTPNWNGGRTYKLGKKVKLHKTFTISAKNNQRGYRTITVRHYNYSYVKSQYKLTKSRWHQTQVLDHKARVYSNKGQFETTDSYPSELVQHSNPAKYFYDEFGIGSVD